MQVQVIGLVICAVLSAAFAEVYFEEKFKDGMYSIIFFFSLHHFECNEQW